MQIPYNITDRSIMFFANGRPWNVSADNKNFDTIRTILLSQTVGRGGVDNRTNDQVQAIANQLVDLADEGAALIRASKGKLIIEGNELIYNGEILHNVWVDKIISFKTKDEKFTPVFNALEDLQKNPTPEARDRLPIFVERSKLGFLPDGRICAFKVVRHDYTDVHTGTLDNHPGKHVEIPRDRVDPNPDQTCSYGLHLGALEYIPSFGLYNHDRRVMLCAFWPRDAVAVPVDYNGSKLRVCAYDVLSELDKKFIEDFMTKNQTTITGYDYAGDDGDEEEDETPERRFQLNQWVEIDEYGNVGLIRAYRYDDEYEVQTHDGIESLSDGDLKPYRGDVPPPAYLLANEGDRVYIENDIILRDGEYIVERIEDVYETHPDSVERIVVLLSNGAEVPIMSSSVKRIVATN